MNAELPPPSCWLTIVGIGADGAASLLPAARAAIEQAALVAGSARQLAAVRELVRAEVWEWPSPLSEGIAKLWERRGQPTCILASGDPFFYGLGATLARALSPGEFVCHPAPSSMSLAAARLGWPLQDCDVVSLHGRSTSDILRYLQPGRRVLALSWDRNTPRVLAQLLCDREFGGSKLWVLQALGSADEQIHTGLARQLAREPMDYADLNLIALELEAGRGARILPCRASLPDDAFQHDGQLTKQDVRAITLSALAPYAGALLWDVGAGAGSIGIEWMLCHPACRALAIEEHAERCARIQHNAQALGTAGLRVIEGSAPQSLRGLPEPDAVFIGGGAGDAGVFEACWEALRPGGRLVINGVALETEALLIQWHARYGGELRRIGIESAAPLGWVRGWKPAMTITQWRIDKP